MISDQSPAVGFQVGVLHCFLFSENDLNETLKNLSMSALFTPMTKKYQHCEEQNADGKEIENFILWSKDNRLKFIFDKFEIVPFLFRKKIKQTTLDLPTDETSETSAYFSQKSITDLLFDRCSTKK